MSDPALLSDYPELLTTRHVAQIMHLRPRSVAVQAARGTLPGAVKFGGEWRFARNVLAKVLGEDAPEPLSGCPEVLTTRHLAAVLHVPRRRVTEHAREIPGAVKFGGEWRFSRSVLVRAMGGEAAEPLSGCPEVLTTRHLAAVLHFSAHRVAILAAGGRIPGAVKISGEWRFTRRRLVDAMTGPAPEPC